MKHDVAQNQMTRSDAIELITDSARNLRDAVVDLFPNAGRRHAESVSLRLQQRESQQRSKSATDVASQRVVGNFLLNVAKACDPVATHHDEISLGLKRAANEGDPTAGGFAVPPQVSESILLPIFSGESVFGSLVDRRETANPIADVKIPGIDETSRVDGFQWGGVTVYWEGESAQAPASFPREKMLDFSGKKITGIVRASRELMNDAPMFGSVVAKGFAAVGGYKLDAAILSGTGAGMPQGILNSSCLITVAKETGQAAATIVSENVSKMWSRFPVPCRRRGLWFCNEDVGAQLETIGGATGPAQYMPAGTGGNPYPLLKGRPVIVLEQSPILGAVGDIALVDPSQYILIDGGAKTALSVHSRFDNDEVVFRFTWRVDGKGAYSSPITPANSSSTRSPFITLAAR